MIEPEPQDAEYLSMLSPKWSWGGDKLSAAKPGVKKILRIFIALAVLTVLGASLLSAPTMVVNAILVIFSFFVLLMASLRILAVLITIPSNKSPQLHNIPEILIWPKFTVLVPLYNEAHMVVDLIKYLGRIDYPKERVEFILITEQDDELTCEAVRHSLISANGALTNFNMFVVPTSHPRTKPKALNVALASIPKSQTGDIVTVYDAEDRPHPNQLKEAALAFHKTPELAVVQAPLGYYNDKENLLTAQFGLEYAALFHVWNPAMARLGLIFTLGGTSNHIRRDVLERCGGWDSHNVTEDADLSFRISTLRLNGRRLKIGTISAPTLEEAVGHYHNWTAQRSRWLKGFMQTWCVHMRFHKLAPDGEKISGAARLNILFSLQITIGATLLAAFLHLPSLLIMALIFRFGDKSEVPTISPVILLSVVTIGYGAAILTAIIGANRAKKPHLFKHAVFMPVYWLMYFKPALVAAWEIVTAPAYWRKTTHRGNTTKKCENNFSQKPIVKSKAVGDNI